MSFSDGSTKSSPRPCVGVCYYKKLMGLEKKVVVAKSPNETIQVRLFFPDYLKTVKLKSRMNFIQ